MSDENKLSLGAVEKTSRGRWRVRFMDKADDPCTIEIGDSGYWKEPVIEAGVDGNDDAMLLNRPQVQALINHFQAWLDRGTFEILP